MEKQEIYRRISTYFEDKPVKKVSVFGSYATGEESESSDIDVVVDTEKPVGLMELSRYKNDLEDLLGIKVDLGTSKGLSEPMISQVQESSSVVYES